MREIHTEYLEAGAQILRTNTFAANSFCMDRSKEQIEETREAAYAWRGKRWLRGENAPVRQKKSILPEISDRFPGMRWHRRILYAANTKRSPYFSGRGERTFLSLKLFPRWKSSCLQIKMIGEQAFITVQFSVNQFGYSNAGLSARKLLQRAGEAKEIDAVGFNCGVGPSHMHRILQILEKPEGKLLTALPNAGYPQMVTGRMLFTGDNKDYFVDRMQQMTALGVDMAGGCCGTTPEYIAELAGKLDLTQYPQAKKDTEPEKQRHRRKTVLFIIPKSGGQEPKADRRGTGTSHGNR